jgi:NAD+ synthase (glutamine-hydrolysing)
MRGFSRLSVAVPVCRVADFKGNAQATLQLWQEAHELGSSVVLFPELGVSGYTARDLFLDQHLLSACENAVLELVKASKNLTPMAVVGMPLRTVDGLYNIALAIQGGKILGAVPKTYLPNYREFEETRWFRPGSDVADGSEAHIGAHCFPFGRDVLFKANAEFIVGLEICEDFWVHLPPSSYLISGGASVVCNLSASNFTVGKAEVRRTLARSISHRGKAVYMFVAAGPGESSTDLAFDADAFICEAGDVLSESKRFLRENQIITVDVDLSSLMRDRYSTNTFGDCSARNRKPFRMINFKAAPEKPELMREVSPHPFLPSDPETLATRCWETFEIQSNALATRIEAIGDTQLILGVSGGIDSTHALLACVAALDLLGRDRSQLHCITMPGLGTTVTTRSNAETLCNVVGATFREIGVSELSHLVLSSIDHPAVDGTSSVDELLNKLRQDPDLGNVALENVQARLRTLVLMALANQLRGIVIGTGDLSEKALGWSTYSGDHISMYDVNCGVPKTLIQFVIRWAANERAGLWADGEDLETLRKTLFDVLDTPISPELLPANAAGEIAQLTEDTIGPYELHDFFLFHFVRHGSKPGRILDLAYVAFEDRYDSDTLKKWCTLFFRRFFTNQFKRTCTPDGPKVGAVALSPRGDWRMPSDAKHQDWLDSIEQWQPVED